MFSKFRRRSSKLEHLDLGDYTAEEYEGCLAELKQVNRWLGDARALRTTLLRTIRELQTKPATRVPMCRKANRRSQLKFWV